MFSSLLITATLLKLLLSTPIPLTNNTPIAIASTTPSYYTYSYTITPEMVPISVNILLEGTSASYLGAIYATINGSSTCTYNENPTVDNYCYYSGWAAGYSIVSLNFKTSDIIAISAYISIANTNFNIKVMAYNVFSLPEISSLTIDSLGSTQKYVFNRYFSFIHDSNKAESVNFILEGVSSTDTANIYLSSNCSKKTFHWFPSSISNLKGTSYSGRNSLLSINLEPEIPCLVSVALAIGVYNQGFNFKIQTYTFVPMLNNTNINIDSLNSTVNYQNFFRLFSYIPRIIESPGSINIVVTGASTSDLVRIYANTNCSKSCKFSYFPDSSNNCWSTSYSSQYQILTVTFDTSACFIAISILVDSYSAGLQTKAIIYPNSVLRNNTFVSIYPVDSAITVIPFWRYFSFQAKINGSANILLEGDSVKDIGGTYAGTDCESGCYYTNFPSKVSNCYKKYESQRTFVAINLYTSCNISIGVYVSQISSNFQLKVVMYPIIELPNGVPVLIDSLNSNFAYELFARYYTFTLKESDAMGNLTLTLQGITNSDNGQLFVSTDCQSNCTYNPYPVTNSYCYQTTYNFFSSLQIYLQSACKVSISAYISSYNIGFRITGSYYNICPNKINLCTTCNLTDTADPTTACYGCTNYYAADPTHKFCQFCNQTTGYYVNLNNNGLCTLCQANCYNCTNGDICLLCNQGYLLDQITPTQTKCSCAVSNCSLCASGGQCTQCDYGFGLMTKNNLCMPCLLENCLICSFMPNTYKTQCDQCVEGMIYHNNTCQTCATLQPNCSVCMTWNTCSLCPQGFYLTAESSARVCNPCGDTYTTGCLVCSSDYSCSSCIEGYYLAFDQTCKKCSMLYSNCLNCNIQNCTLCSEGYFLGSTSTCDICTVGNCSQCSEAGALCEVCKSGFTLFDNTCLDCNDNTGLSNCMSCELGTTNSCLTCKDTFYSVGSGACQSCFSIAATCIECLNSSYCTKCDLNAFLYRDIGTSTCVGTCPDNYVKDSEGLICLTCAEAFGVNCLKCSSNGCLVCWGEEAYVYGNSCSSCNGTNVKIFNASHCVDSPIISLFKVINIDFFVNIQINCSIESKAFIVYGLMDSIDGYLFSNVSNIDGIIPTIDIIYDYIGYVGLQTDVSGFLNVTLNGPFKNNGQLYKAKAWCQAKNALGTLTTNSSTVNWTQPSNGAKVVKILLISGFYITFDKKSLVAQAIQQALVMERNVYTEDFMIASSSASSRLLQNYQYNYSFYIMPDYKLAFDYMENVVNSSLKNSTRFALNIQNYLKGLDPLNSANFINSEYLGSYDNLAEYQSFLGNYPQFTIQNQTIIVSYIIKENGTIYLGAKLSDNGLSVSSSGVVNGSLSWNSFKNRLDYNGNSLKAYASYTSQKNVLRTVNLTGLAANTSYFVFYGAGNNGWPQNTTVIGIKELKTGWLYVNNSDSSNFGWRIRKVWMMSLLLIGLFSLN